MKIGDWRDEIILDVWRGGLLFVCGDGFLFGRED
ncbi:hypothetical protein CUROG_00525 [Corynebacterium urogenitale]|uniref:Uncharacterized protein n=1 Tax=Corynebacterium urogenitale TaxID=2487892 RepID=A0A5J6Z833_9CORY|nr:hypothetical protein CUROG_00525 [Corynebacterium urogenitale]